VIELLCYVAKGRRTGRGKSGLVLAVRAGGLRWRFVASSGRVTATVRGRARAEGFSPGAIRNGRRTRGSGGDRCEVPLPPYIEREVGDADTGDIEPCTRGWAGAVAASAGRDAFTEPMFETLSRHGVEVADSTFTSDREPCAAARRNVSRLIHGSRGRDDSAADGFVG